MKTDGLVRPSPFFSIVTITKNDPQGFEKTRQSVNEQSCADYEWIVIDGAIEPDNGIYDAMNKGIDRSAGLYLVFMNSGDVFAGSETLDAVRAVADGYDLIYGDAYENGYVKKARRHTAIRQGMITHHQAVYYRRALAARFRYDEGYPIAADYKLTAQVITGGYACLYLPRPLCVFEGGGISEKRTAQGRAEQAAIRRELGLKAPLTPLRQWIGQVLKQASPRLYGLVRRIV